MRRESDVENLQTVENWENRPLRATNGLVNPGKSRIAGSVEVDWPSAVRCARRHKIADQLSELSEGQISCLRLVAQGMSSKEIARETGLSHYTVDTYIKRALPLVGATNRRDAARIVLDAEQSQKLVPQPETVVSRFESRTLQPSTTHGSTNDASRRMFKLPKIGGEINDLAWIDRHYAIIKVAAFGFSIILAITLVMAGLLWVFE